MIVSLTPALSQEAVAAGGDKRDCKQDGRDDEGGTSDTGDKSEAQTDPETDAKPLRS